MEESKYLKKLYQNRFHPEELKAKNRLWKVLIDYFLQRYIDPTGSLLDIGGGYCEFINQVQVREKYLLDLNPDSQSLANPDVQVLNLDILDEQVNEKVPYSLDAIFTSNFFEHLRSKEELIQILSFCFNHLKPGGSLLILQPNFKYSYKEYYDFIDHHLPLTHLSLEESLRAVGFSVEKVIPKFLPFSTKGRPASSSLLKIYLALPLLWKFLGGQMFIKAAKPINY